METEQFVFCYFATHLAAYVMKHTWSSRKFPDIFTRFQSSLEILGSFSLKVLSMNVHKNPYSGSRSDTCEQTDGRTDTTTLTIASHYLCELTSHFERRPKLTIYQVCCNFVNTLMEHKEQFLPLLAMRVDTLQNRQCSCNVTLRRVRANIVAVEKQ